VHSYQEDVERTFAENSAKRLRVTRGLGEHARRVQLAFRTRALDCDDYVRAEAFTKPREIPLKAIAPAMPEAVSPPQEALNFLALNVESPCRIFKSGHRLTLPYPSLQ
jgi:hypothetical protein